MAYWNMKHLVHNSAAIYTFFYIYERRTCFTQLFVLTDENAFLRTPSAIYLHLFHYFLVCSDLLTESSIGKSIELGALYT